MLIDFARVLIVYENGGHACVYAMMWSRLGLLALQTQLCLFNWLNCSYNIYCVVLAVCLLICIGQWKHWLLVTYFSGAECKNVVCSCRYYWFSWCWFETEYCSQYLGSQCLLTILRRNTAKKCGTLCVPLWTMSTSPRRFHIWCCLSSQ